MAELVRGSVRDQPWGLMLAGLSDQGLTGQLKLQAENRRYVITFEDGRIVGASSPLPADSVVRIALTMHLVTGARSAALQKALVAAPERDETDVVAETAGLTGEQADKLRKRVLRQRAARTFALDEGELVVTEAMPARPRAAVDVHAVIYLGARMFASEERLSDDLRRIGSSFKIKPSRAGDLPSYGFTDAEQPVVEGLRQGASIAELEAAHHELDPRMLRAVVYALASCGTCENVTIAGPRTLTRARSGMGGMTDSFIPAPPEEPPTGLPTGTGAARKLVAGGAPPTKSLVDETDLDLGPAGTTPATSRKRSRGDSLLDLGAAGADPSTPRTKTPRGPIVQPRQPAQRPHLEAPDERTRAKEHFLRGAELLRADRHAEAIAELARAISLDPVPDYQAALAWTRYCANPDSIDAAAEARDALETAIIESSTLAHLFLGRLERGLGRDREALRHFQEVALQDPDNVEIATEVRELEGRLAKRGR